MTRMCIETIQYIIDFFCLKFGSDFMLYVYINCWAPLSVLCLFSDVHFPLQVLHIPQFSEINSIHGESWVVFRMSISGEVTDSLPGTWNVICEATCNAGLLWLAIHLSWIGAALWLALAWSHDLCAGISCEATSHSTHTDETFSY